MMNYTSFNRIVKSDTLQKVLDKIKDGTIREFLDDWKWIFTFTGQYKRRVLLYTVLGLLSSTFNLVASYLSSRLINIIIDKQVEKLPLIIAFVLCSMLFSLGIRSVMSLVSAKLSVNVNNDIQKELFDSIIDTEWSSLNHYKSGDLVNRFQNDIATISSNAVGWIPKIVIGIYTFALTFVVLYRLDPIMAAIALASAPFLLVMSRIIMRKQKAYRRKVLEMDSDMMSFASETFYNLDTVKAFGVFGVFSHQLKAWQKKYAHNNLNYNAFSIKTNIALTSVTTAVSFAAFGYCLFRLWSGKILYGDMTFFLGQRTELSTQFSALVALVPGMLNSAVSARRVREVIELPKEEHNLALLTQFSEKTEKGLSIQMKNVSFSYSDGENIYKDANFTANPGEIVAVIGGSGGGKTTFFRLLLGLCNPDEGSVRLCDCEGNAVEVNADLRRLVSYVPQGNTMMLGSIADNLRMVKPDATEEELAAALKAARAWEFAEQYGLFNELGERGKGISEGQAQRVAIARALLRDAPILLLDEATSALDEATEMQVLANILLAAPNKTIIVSTHRPSAIGFCQKVYRIEENRLAEIQNERAEL